MDNKDNVVTNCHMNRTVYEKSLNKKLVVMNDDMPDFPNVVCINVRMSKAQCMRF